MASDGASHEDAGAAAGSTQTGGRGSTGVVARSALAFVILLGVVSLFGDMVYEGARSITGPYLAVLGASATAVGIVAGFGEFVGYGLRLVSGYISDRTQRYWSITLVGYSLTMIAVPLLALAGRWEVAALLIVLERTGKAIRTPARDAMLSHATARMGRGWGFGIHEALDQAGATIGALVVAVAVATGDDYQTGFAILAIPGILTLTVLLAAWRLYPHPRELEPVATSPAVTTFPRRFWIYLAAVAAVAAGYADFPLIAFHFQEEAIIRESVIPLYFAVAMAVDTLTALVFGRVFDRVGLPILVLVALLSAGFAPLVFLGGASLALVGVALWGIGLGAQESIMRAAVAPMVAAARRGTAYGIFNTGYGLSWFLGSVIMGLLYDLSLPGLILFSAAMQLLSIPLLLAVGRARNNTQTG
jgi:predicted MFS family arabinose efflux permease